jgi:hypothetical protein
LLQPRQFCCLEIQEKQNRVPLRTCANYALWISDGILPRTPTVIQIVMAHAAKLGVLTDELVTLLTATSAKVSLCRFVSWILERDKRNTFFRCYTKAWANANTI